MNKDAYIGEVERALSDAMDDAQAWRENWEESQADLDASEERCARLVELIDLMRPLLPRPTLMQAGARADARRRVDELMVELGLMEGEER